ncbi:hypothetical protein PC129_g5245 [Phytophthora cactorum]|uniref:Uncharacterized protein n=1 Tax=Phytophthora cactorum TaxID=29920 RepID=A0A8T1GAN6_9STRA|nr:hypothetical protein Pcac1_g21130 [Phytophthora cactorum]KAG2834654.1 hypothetical protein PC111_g5748 [Phytophthora cactorum]KAG2837551.1 hypothetical protein PC112_g4869 [Phytophthora cactorum]KAG2922617.1 hypothetical protein PC114_g5195 [Phytophthora cactorum]KAG2943884.1 hypothetical protein PC115_g558 [Phytophthora cactorum]
MQPASKFVQHGAGRLRSAALDLGRSLPRVARFQRLAALQAKPPNRSRRCTAQSNELATPDFFVTSRYVRASSFASLSFGLVSGSD